LDYFIIEVSEEQIRKEREAARELRKSRWWKNRVARGLCHYCGGRFAPADLSMDHIVPVIRGGKSTRGNVVPCCKECNNRKKHLLPIEWEEYLAKQHPAAGAASDGETGPGGE
jgi:5-methylcytosine-specific restriction endonuclease McrA